MELVNSILLSKRTDIEVVVTDNVSTDNTIEMLNSIKDERLTIYQNEKAIPAYCNMIEAIFNAKGKYVLYCNDRDLLYMDKVEKLIDLLYDHDFSFLRVSSKKRKNNKLKIYEKGYESLMNQDHTHHPTGMVFNREIIGRYLHKEDYFIYLEDFYTYSFLMRDLIKYEKSAIYNIGCWSQRPKVFLKGNKSGTVFNRMLYFYPEFNIQLAKNTLKHVFDQQDWELSEIQKQNVTLYILNYFSKRLILYKINMKNTNQTSHYGIQPRFVSTKEMIGITRQYNHECLLYLRDNRYSEEAIKRWKKSFPWLLFKAPFISLIADAAILLLYLKNDFRG